MKIEIFTSSFIRKRCKLKPDQYPKNFQKLKIVSADGNLPICHHVEVQTSKFKTKPNTLQILIVTGAAFLVGAGIWLLDEAQRGYKPLYLLLLVSLFYKFLKIIFEWYHYWAICPPRKPVLKTYFNVDMFTTAVPGEPYEMTRRTLMAMVAVRYPHTTYLCDEGNDPKLKQLCEDLGVIHVTRTNRLNAKAGNINNALRWATGEICVILDPDHVPHPDFLHEVLPYFEDETMGFVQIVQAYHNSKKSWIARGAAEQTYTFYGPLMMGMNSYGTVQAIGANCTFRRAALDSIGGHAPGLAEDMHTAMQLHANGWKSVYVPKILARGQVPANLAAYYKQQLKWARGTFELLFTVYPKLFSHFTWRQKLHYFLLPLHFAAGIITMIDILIPVVSLFSGYSPLNFEAGSALAVLLPFAGFVVLIRQYAQRWLMEKNEQGFHLSGGILLISTWWVHLLGFLYTLLRIDVPYIPTPKEDQRANNLIWNIPNIMVCLFGIAAIWTGLKLDWSPYSLTMASYCLLNSLILACTILGSQQLFADKLKKKWLYRLLSPTLWLRLSKLGTGAVHGLYSILRRGAVVFALLILLTTGWATAGFTYETNGSGNQVQKGNNDSAFYTGIYIPQVREDHSLLPVAAFEKKSGNKLSIISLYEFWGPRGLENFPMPLLHRIAESGSIPMITWEPWVSSFPKKDEAPELQRELHGLRAIGRGLFDDYIAAYAQKIRNFGYPVFIRFGHEPDNPQYPWSATGKNTAEDYKSAWRRIVAIFAEQGVQNVSWVYNPWNSETVNDYYPGEQFIDWIGLTCLNYGKASGDGQWRSFEELYQPFRQFAHTSKKPVMLAEFGSTSYGGDGDQWIAKALQCIQKNFKEIRSFVFFNSNKDKNWVTAWRPAPGAKWINWTISRPELLQTSLRNINPAPALVLMQPVSAITNNIHPYTTPDTAARSKPFSLTVNGKPFYIKGVAYNPEHSWQDGHHPLTRRQLETDLQAVKEMGANTIRRYHPSFYDRNILQVTKEKDLKVLYGFWFDPEVDYYRDTAKVEAYMELVLEKVKTYKSEPSILAWSIGNETSGLLKHHFTQPYLTLVRNAYMAMLEEMAQAIKKIDQHHPVTTSLEHSWQLPAEVFTYHHAVPSLDMMGVNSYYGEQLCRVEKIFRRFDPKRPYFISEFGPKGYWNPELTSYDRLGFLREASDAQKAKLYTTEWEKYILPHKGWNLGGVAFCWKDRFEGTATWFGLTDEKGRKKLTYHALKSLWTSGVAKSEGSDLFIAGPLFSLKPGGDYEFTAVLSDPAFKQLEWFILEEGTFHNKDLLTKTAWNKTSFAVPRNEKTYRLYAVASDGHGNVLTANRVVTIHKGIYNDGL